MKKIIIVVLLIASSIGLSGCGTKVPLDGEEVKDLYASGKQKILNNEINLDYLYSLKEGKRDLRVLNLNQHRLEEQTENFERYYRGGYLYTYDKTKETKTKQEVSFDSLGYNKQIEDQLEVIKTLLDDQYIDSISGEKQMRFNSPKFIYVNFNIEKLIEDGFITDKTYVFFTLHFNSENEFTRVEMQLHHTYRSAIYIIGEFTWTPTVTYPDDIEDYQ